ncbi:MAG: hypothetical protein ACTHK7_22055 [Aureliella sp.]
MELFPYKIDWKDYQKHFPTTEATWLREMKTEFPTRDLSGMHDAYGAAFEAMSEHLPAGTRKALGLFVAATCGNYLDSVDFSPYEPEFDGDPEEYLDTPLPHLEPRQMKKVAQALETLLACDYEIEIRSAWQKGHPEKDSMVSGTIDDADEYLAYLRAWIDAFQEIHADGAVLGLGMA